MLIEIKGANFLNKGAELMLLAILARVGSAIKDVKFAMAPNLEDCPYKKIASLGIYSKLYFQRYGIQCGNWFPRNLLRMYGLVNDSEVNAVLDASGFAYGDQWGPDPTIDMAKNIRRWKKQGKKVILLPQAFGPFSGQQIRKAFRIVASQADRIYARDAVSYKHIVDLVGELPNLKQAPDFTGLLEGTIPPSFNRAAQNVAVIPNQRMMDKTSGVTAENYIPFLVTCVRYFLDAGYRPFFLVHGGNEDEQIARKAVQLFGHNVPIVMESNPLHLKGIIGVCKAVVSSRYHGLVSALSQGVPVIGTGWSHKYRPLFDEYGCPEFLLSLDSQNEHIEDILALFTSELEERKKRLAEFAAQHKQASVKMWDDILKIISTTR